MKTSAVVVILAAVFWCGDVNAQENSFLASAGRSNSTDSNQEGVTENQDVKPDVYSLHIVSNIQYRYANTVVTSRVANRANTSQEVFFTVVLPETAFISGFLMEIDGNVYRAHVKEKEEAKKEYDAAVSSGQTAAHVVQSSRNSNRFTVSVNIESEKKVTFNLTYEELLKRELSVYNHAININPGQIVPDLSVEVYINESSKITTLEVPALKESNEINQENATQDNPLAKIERLSDTSAIIRWAPTPEEQKQLNSEGVKGQLVVRYDVDRESHPQQILVNEGYFVHFFAPSNLPTLKKHVTFVLDVSGSMFGKKIEQLREAMTTILSDLRPGDFFSIVIFSTNVQVWDPENNSPAAVDYQYNNNGEIILNTTQPELSRLSVVPVTPSNIRVAKEFVSRLETYSSTNIYGALLKALDVVRLGRNLTSSNDVLYESPEPIIIFLTDGQPNEEESDPIIITDTVTASNSNASASIFCLAFGDYADLDFLKKLSLRNSGFARKIYEASDAALQLQDFYRQVASPLLADVSFNYTESQVEEGSVSKTHFNTLFLGSEFVVAGKLKSTELTGGLTARSPNGTTSLPFGPDIIVICPPFPPTVEPTEEHNVTNASFMERLWAYLTIQQLLEKDEVDSPPEVNTTSPNKKRALELALKYSFVTPLTSLVVVKPNETTSADTEKGYMASAPYFNYYKSSLRTGSSLMSAGVYLNAFGGSYSPLQESQFYRDLYYPESEIASNNSTLSSASGSYSPLQELQFDRTLYYPESEIASNNSTLSSASDSYLQLLESEFYRPLYYLESEFASNNSTLSSASGLTIVPLSSLAWLNNVTSEAGITLPTNPQGAHEVLQLGLNQTNSAFSECTTSLGGSGHCRHLPYCALDVFTLNVTDYLPFFCRIDNFAGVCCPDALEPFSSAH